ncbi:hypothetical protein MtrunA17_Chr6g0482251 [Medicago truncatula]|uniref:Uncharacterized protein n=1 Tax=Medicago truncatula TaxID=3880 RepID=A0A396HMM0_MEDTR|nr:hypothetical protein MtrunA17_Chr6g0482251 [Medicago truncatula]
MKKESTPSLMTRKKPNHHFVHLSMSSITQDLPLSCSQKTMQILHFAWKYFHISLTPFGGGTAIHLLFRFFTT